MDLHSLYSNSLSQLLLCQDRKDTKALLPHVDESKEAFYLEQSSNVVAPLSFQQQYEVDQTK